MKLPSGGQRRQVSSDTAPAAAREITKAAPRRLREAPSLCIHALQHDKIMLSIPKFFLRLAHMSIAANISLAGTASPATFFRSDAGIASTNTGPLPDQFDAPTKLRWRTRVDSGQSTPIVSNGRIFLTTYRAA